LHPASYHWLNLLLHLANTALVFLFIRMLSGGRLWTTVVTSLFFGIHPMHVESVAWIAERKDVLFALFYLLGLIAYLRYLERRQLLWLGTSLLAFVLSVASKPAAVVFPVTLWTIDYFRRRAFNVSVLVEKVPFLAVSLAAGILTLKAQQSVGAVADLHHWNPVDKLLIASYGTLMYVVKLFVPVRLSALYPYPNVRGKGLGPEFYLAFVALAVLLPTIVYLCRRVRVVLFGLAFFFVNIALVLQFFAIGQAVMAERYTYLPYIGLFFALAWWLDERPGPIAGGVPVRLLVAGSFVLLLPLSLFQTWTRCDVWQNAETLWTDTIQKYPDTAPPYSGRGLIKVSRGDLAGAVADYSRAIEVNSTYRDAYINRAIAYVKMHEYEKSIADRRRAIELDPRNPGTYLEYGYMGEAFQRLNQNDSAYAYFDRALELNPGYSDALNNRGVLKMWRGDVAGAVADFSRTIAQNASHRGAYANRATAYAKMREYEKSIADSRRAIELEPGNPNNYLEYGSMGVTFQQLGRNDSAYVCFDRAIALNPNYPEALSNRGVIKVWRGDLTGAVTDFSRAIALNPKYRGAYANRSIAYAKLHEPEKSAADRRKAVEP
jgi:tetratricopeptide (TPR) repeat protein